MAASEPLRYALNDTWELVAVGARRTRAGVLTADLVLQHGTPIYVAPVALNDPAALDTFAAAAHTAGGHGGVPAPPVAALVAGLTILAANALIGLEVGDGPKPTQAGELAALAQDADLWHTPDGKPYASIAVDGHIEHWPIAGKGFRDWLGYRFYQESGKVPGSQALQDALTTLAGKARFEGATHPVHVRVAAHDGALYLDLGNERWEVVGIDPTLPHGWAILDAPPVRFRRPRGMAPLPSPVPNGDLNMLRPFLNCGSDEDWQLFVAWLLSTLHPRGPYPVLGLHGEQGSAKSTTSRVLVALADPSTTPLRTGPRDERDLAIAANNRRVVAFDNLSKLPDWLSDGLCRLATGGGFGTRELYSDDEEILFDLTRPVLLNGIEELATRGDLLERTILRYLPTIADTQRRDEETFWREFEAARPALLGALLTVVAGALATLPTVVLEHQPRMADFARWVTAAEPALGWAPGTFLAAYERNRTSGHEAALEASAVAAAIKTLADDLSTGEVWQGTAGDLLAALERLLDERTTKRRDWPQTPRAMSGLVRRYAPVLRALGVTIEYRREGSKAGRRLIVLHKNTPAPDRQDRQNGQRAPGDGVERLTVEGMAEGVTVRTAPVLSETVSRPSEENTSAGAGNAPPPMVSDDADDPMRQSSWAVIAPQERCQRCGDTCWYQVPSGRWVCGTCYPPVFGDARPSGPSDTVLWGEDDDALPF